jgi:phenylacetate-CoA ligase
MYPDLSHDSEHEEEMRRHRVSTEKSLAEFVRYTVDGDVGSGRNNPVWGQEEKDQISRHPVYRGESYKSLEFGSLPFLSRQILRTTADPFDYEAAGSKLAYANQTSGTSGAPLTVVYSPPYMAQYETLSVLKVGIRAGLKELGARPVFSVFLTDNPSVGSGVLLPGVLGLVGHQLLWPVDPADPASVARATDMLRALDPEVVSSKPNLFSLLIERWQDAGLPVPCRPRYGLSGGAMLPDQIRSRFESFFQAPLLSSYNISELGYLGSECRERKIHLDESLHQWFELVPLAAQEPADDGTGELAVTSLTNRCMPLVRYRVGDIVRMSRDTCACEGAGPVLDELRGRTTIIFDLGEGQQLSPTRYMNLFKNNPGLLEYQLTQEKPRSFLVRAQPRADVPADARAALCESVRDEIAAGMPVPADVRCEESVFEQEGAKFARFRSEVTA